MKNIKITLIFTILLLCSATMIFSQKNVVKLGLGGLALGNVNLSYERVLSENQSVALNIGFMPSRNIPEFILEASDVPDFENSISGFSITPEYRFYTSKKNAPKGFYVAPYAKLSNYKFEFNETYDGITGVASGKYATIGVGAQLGVQWLISDRVSIDWYFLGLGVNRNSLSMKFESNSQEVNYASIADDIKTDLEDIPILGSRIEVTSGDDFVEAKAPFIFPALRSGISIGVAF